MFTIITICKNCASTISNTIENVLSQNCMSEVEYIVVDGGSTDETMKIVYSYGDKISKIISEPDKGISDAFNKGIKSAKGEIIGMINSDDSYLPGVLKKVEEYLAEYPEVEVIHADLLLLDGERLLKLLKPPRYWWIPWRMILFNHPTTFVRRHVYDICGLYDSSYRYSMDFELFLRWIKAGMTIRYLPEVFVKMQVGGASGRNIYQGFKENLRAQKRHDFNMPLAYFQFLLKHIVQCILDCKVLLLRGVRYK